MGSIVDGWRRLVKGERAGATPPARKMNAASVLARHGQGRPLWTPRHYAGLMREGFVRNAVGYRCVRMIAEAASAVPFVLYENDREHSRHPLVCLLARPNPVQGGAVLMEQFYSHLQISGNAYLKAVTLDDTVRELHVLRPDRMKIIPGADGWPECYEYEAGGRSVRFDQNRAGPVRAILHARLFNPDDDYYGLSPFTAAARSVDIHNAASLWNKALLDNAARPSGALVYEGADHERNLTQEQFSRLKDELEAAYQGAANAGRPMVLEGGLDWKSMGFSPKDMDFIEAKHVAAREIALAFGVPPMLLGIPGDNTFANYAEANRTFWHQTVLPLVARTAQALGNWLTPAYGRDLRVRYDADAVDALACEREALWQRVERASFLTINEKRAAVGYEAITTGDRLSPPHRPTDSRSTDSLD